MGLETASRAFLYWENGRLVRSMDGPCVEHATDETSVVPVRRHLGGGGSAGRLASREKIGDPPNRKFALHCGRGFGIIASLNLSEANGGFCGLIQAAWLVSRIARKRGSQRYQES